MAKKQSDKKPAKPTPHGEELEFALEDKSFTEDVFSELHSRGAIEAGEDPEAIEGELDVLESKVESVLGAAAEADAAFSAAFGDEEKVADPIDVSGTELQGFESAEVEDVEELAPEEIMSAVESLLFATDRPQSAASLKAAFQGTKVRVSDIRAAIERLQIEYSNRARGVTIEEIAGGYQIRTKTENQKYLLRTVKARPFRLSGPALEVLAIVAYKQPCTKSMVDDVRGVESGHLMRGLLDRGLIHFAGKSDLPGRPMTYETTRKFLEIFNLRNINELPTLHEIDQLIPEGIGEEVVAKPELKDITGELSASVENKSYSEGEDELLDISGELKAIETTTAFFEDEKRRSREKRDADRAQEIRERLTIGEAVDERDQKWLSKFELQGAIAAAATEAVTAPEPANETAPVGNESTTDGATANETQTPETP